MNFILKHTSSFLDDGLTLKVAQETPVEFSRFLPKCTSYEFVKDLLSLESRHPCWMSSHRSHKPQAQWVGDIPMECIVQVL